MRTAYCPWCGYATILQSMAVNGEMDWVCITPRCRGTLETVTTDQYGFVLSPYILKDRYIFTSKLHGEGQDGLRTNGKTNDRGRGTSQGHSSSDRQLLDGEENRSFFDGSDKDNGKE